MKEIRVFQACHSERKVFRAVVPSESKPGEEYEISGSILSGQVSCSCPGFKFRGYCKHVHVDVESCGWNAVTSPEPQTMEQKRNMTCPRCGSRTVEFGTGDY